MHERERQTTNNTFTTKTYAIDIQVRNGFSYNLVCLDKRILVILFFYTLCVYEDEIDESQS